MSVTTALHQHMQTITQWLAGRDIRPARAGIGIVRRPAPVRVLRR